MFKRIILSFGTILLLAVSAPAQIQGGVYDQKGQGIPNAVVIATNSIRNFSDTVLSDKRGFYAFKGLERGKYEIEVKASGFLIAIYENIQANEDDTDEDIQRDDISSATRLEIILKPAKSQK